MSPIINRTSSSFGFSSKKKILSSIPYSGVIPTNNLYSHWDFSVLADAVGTTYTTDGTAITSASGYSIGGSPTTPQLYHRRSGTGTFSTTISTQNGRKCLSLAANTGTQNQGAFLNSDGNAFPNIGASDSYTWISVWKHTTTISNYTRMYRWYLAGYSYDFNHGTYWVNSSNDELDVFNYAAASKAVAITSGSNRGSTSFVHYDVVSVTGSLYNVSYNTSLGLPNAASGTISGITYSTQVDANRYFQIRPVDYATNTTYPALVACEFAFYNRSMDSTERSSVISTLRSKWG